MGVMSLQELKDALDSVAWDEQMDFEQGERDPEHSRHGLEVEEALRSLGRRVTPPLLDALEREVGYVLWALRLSPYVRGAQASTRASRWLNAADPALRYWADRVFHGWGDQS